MVVSSMPLSFAGIPNFVYTLPFYKFNIQFMYDNLNVSFLLWNKLHLYFVTFLLPVSIWRTHPVVFGHLSRVAITKCVLHWLHQKFQANWETVVCNGVDVIKHANMTFNECAMKFLGNRAAMAGSATGRTVHSNCHLNIKTSTLQSIFNSSEIMLTVMWQSNVLKCPNTEGWPTFQRRRKISFHGLCCSNMGVCNCTNFSCALATQPILWQEPCFV